MNDEEINKKIKDLVSVEEIDDIVEAIENKDVPFVITQIKGLIREVYLKGYKEGRNEANTINA